MGLDMFLNATLNSSNEQVVNKVKSLFPETSEFNPENISVTIPVGYWRKANQIHKWFVDNIQEGTDDCREYYASRENLEKLKDACEAVLKFPDIAHHLLPTQSGFFFGCTAYDEYYLNDLARTVEIIEKCLKLPKGWCFMYQSSW